MIRCHQRKLRDEMAVRFPRDVRRDLSGYSVETVSKSEAVKIILHYEWLGTLGRSTVFVGLMSPDREVEGVACFGYGPQGGIRLLIGEPAYCLERGACVHYAPRNAASFLINSACKLVYRSTGVDRFFAYADPMAGEYGGVYQAAGWSYLGQGLDGRTGRARRFSVLPPRSDPNNPASWKSTRELRRKGNRLSFAEAREAGWKIALREAKHVYATNVGVQRRRWRKNLVCPAYPSPHPELKREPRNAGDTAPSRATQISPMRLEYVEPQMQSAFEFQHVI